MEGQAEGQADGPASKPKEKKKRANRPYQTLSMKKLTGGCVRARNEVKRVLPPRASIGSKQVMTVFDAQGCAHQGEAAARFLAMGRTGQYNPVNLLSNLQDGNHGEQHDPIPDEGAMSDGLHDMQVDGHGDDGDTSQAVPADDTLGRTDTANHSCRAASPAPKCFDT